MNRKYSDQDYANWAEAYASGLSSRGVAELFGVKAPTVKRALSKMGVLRSLSKANKGRTPWNKGQKGLQEAWNKGMAGNYPYPSPMKGVPSPYKGVQKPTEFKQKVSDTWKKKVEDGYDNWNVGWKTPYEGRECETDILYFVIVADTQANLFPKIGRSFRGPYKRLQRSLVTTIATWEAPHWWVWWAEHSILHTFEEWRSRPVPSLECTGGTECFRPELPLNEVVRLVNSLHMAISSQAHHDLDGKVQRLLGGASVTP